MGVRCFVSVDVEDPGILDAIELVQGSLKATGADLKAVKKENIHLTLKFLGDVDEGTLEEMKGIISGIIFNPFWMELRGVGTFPNLRRPRVVWVGLTQGVEELRQIFERLEAGLTGLGFKPEKRRFSPHLTIARVRSGRNKIQLGDEVMSQGYRDFGGFEVRHIRLKKSVLTPRGPIYTTLVESAS